MLKMEVYPVKFTIEGIGEAEGEFYRVKAPRSVEDVYYALPVSGRAKIYENAELYFLIDIQVKAEHPTFDVTEGDIAYWPMGKAICVFWDKVKPYSEVNIMGKITKNLDVFKQAKNMSRVILEKRE
ncbi:MAG: cyclophilin-like fold protein [Candidatus Heimdallarchaeota archaeon]